MINESELNPITGDIIAGAMVVHTAIGPGLLESAYEACLEYELIQRGHRVQRQVPMPLEFKGVALDCGYRLDLLVDDIVVVELKAVEKLTGIHMAQALSYLKLSRKPAVLLINFHVLHLKDGIKRFVA